MPVIVKYKGKEINSTKTYIGKEIIETNSKKGKEICLSSANLCAGIGAKGSKKRNFEAGILTDDFAIVDAACNQFDDVWAGGHCKNCRFSQFCVPVK